MAFSKITTTELNSRGATTLPNQPTITAAALKQEFDAPAKEIVAPKFNQLIDDLEADTAAENIGITPPTGRTGANIQALVDDISSDLAAVETETGKFSEHDGELFYNDKNVNGSIDNSVANIKIGANQISAEGEDTVEIIPGAGVTFNVDEDNKTITMTAAGGGGGGDMTMAVYDTNHNGIVDKAESINDGTISVSAEEIQNATKNGLQYVRKYDTWDEFLSAIPFIINANNLNHVYFCANGGYVGTDYSEWFYGRSTGDYMPPSSYYTVGYDSFWGYQMVLLGDGSSLYTPVYFKTQGYTGDTYVYFETDIPIRGTEDPSNNYYITDLQAEAKVGPNGGGTSYYTYTEIVWGTYPDADDNLFYYVKMYLPAALDANVKFLIGIARRNYKKDNS